MKRLYASYLFMALWVPVLFLFYLKYDLVCLPRAIYFEMITGALSTSLLVLAFSSDKKWLYYLAISVPAIIIFITPIVMLKRLGWDTFIERRLIAFFTFEIVAIVQIFIIRKLMKKDQKISESNQNSCLA